MSDPLEMLPAYPAWADIAYRTADRPGWTAYSEHIPLTVETAMAHEFAGHVETTILTAGRKQVFRVRRIPPVRRSQSQQGETRNAATR